MAAPSTHDEPGVVYPPEVENAGPRGKELYDACLRELTTGDTPATLEEAEFIVRQDWPELLAHLAAESTTPPA